MPNTKAVLLDIEGTTIESHFLKNSVFPLIHNNYNGFLRDTYESQETKELIRKMREISKSGEIKGMPKIVVGNKEEVISSVISNLKWQSQNQKTNHTIFMDLLCWVWVYENKRIQIKIYDDVVPNLHKWKVNCDIKIYTYSSALALAQKLVFVRTNHGNVYTLIDDFFDSSIGNKTDTESYKRISNRMGIEVNKILFITDDPKEAKTAINAGLQSVVIKRPGNKATNEFSEIPRITSFNEI